MTYRDAVKSGKPFKRPHHTGYAVYVKREEGGTLKSNPPLQWIDDNGKRYGSLVLSLEDHEATDWEVKNA